MKKGLMLFALVLGCMTGHASAREDAFPAQQVQQNGVVRYGYMKETGEILLPFTYESAGEFSEDGLAAVTDENKQTGVIDSSGKLVVPYIASPIEVSFASGQIAYRYENKTVLYDAQGKKIGVFPGNTSFFYDDLILVEVSQQRYAYYNRDGVQAFEETFVRAGDFKQGTALVQRLNGMYAVIDQNNVEKHALAYGITPVTMELWDDTTIVQSGSRYYLYSIRDGEFISDGFDEIQTFHNSLACAKQNGVWGLLSVSGGYRIRPEYYSLSYMGEGIYAARDMSGAAMAIDGNGNSIYRTSTYVGGFDTMRFGIGWHGTSDGTLVFFTSVGGYYTSIENAENPYLLTKHVARVTQNGKLTYINLETGQELVSQADSYVLGTNITAKSQSYYKFTGYATSGEKYAWNISYPVLSGVEDSGIEAKLNEKIYSFFLNGPQLEAKVMNMTGTYGISLQGRVLVVSANCVYTAGGVTSIWNESLALNINTAEDYYESELFTLGYQNEIQTLLPEGISVSALKYPRIAKKGVTYYRVTAGTQSQKPTSEAYYITFEQLEDYLLKESACYRALSAQYMPKANTRFDDVAVTHWAFGSIEGVYQKGLMLGVATNGDAQLFRPDATITYAEAVCVARRACAVPVGNNTTFISENTWYRDEVNAAYDAGLLKGLEEAFRPLEPITREDAMQLFAHVLEQRVSAAETPVQMMDTDTALAAFADANQISSARREAVADCVRAGIVEGSGGNLRPTHSLTRAEYAKLVLTATQ